MNTSFNWNRFLCVLRYDLAANWHTSLVFFCVLTFTLVGLYSIGVVDNSAEYSTRLEVGMVSTDLLTWSVEWASANTVMCYWLFIASAGCFIFLNMRNKQQKIVFLSQPVSHIEKFVARLLWVTVGLTIIFFAAAVVADRFRALLCTILDFPAYGVVWLNAIEFLDNNPSNLFYGEGDLMINTLMWYLTLLTVQSVYVLGGVLLARNNWLIITGFMIVVVLLLVYLGIPVLSFEQAQGMAGNVILAINIGLRLMLITCCYILSYKKFCSMQVINNKWINV
ncbi:MAG: hypothetical protein J6Q93_00535 [Prevotella sp.]|nr:hypothetical protein [Prevotella sp.]